MQVTKHHFLLVFVIGILGVIWYVIGTQTAISPTHEDGVVLTSTLSATTTADTVVNTPPTMSDRSEAGNNSLNVSNSPQALPKSTGVVGRNFTELVRPNGYSNIDTLPMLSTDQFTIGRFVGKNIILVEFFTPSSLASLHTIPYLNAWHGKYKDAGLLIIGIHTPQYSFERSKIITDQFIFAEQIHFPVVIDADSFTWHAYKNSVWPHQYLIDMRGKVVYEHVGDGSYEATEAKIMELLSAKGKNEGKPITFQPFRVPEGAFTVAKKRAVSPEVFFGASRNTKLFGGVALKEGIQNFETQTVFGLQSLVLSGSWNFSKEYAQNMTENCSVTYRYTAKDVFATLQAEKNLKLTILLDNKPLDTTNAGKDVRFEKGASVVFISNARIYELVKQSAGTGEHTLTLIPERGGLHAYSLAFE